MKIGPVANPLKYGDGNSGLLVPADEIDEDDAIDGSVDIRSTDPAGVEFVNH